VREFDELLKKYKEDGADLLERIAKLEVSHRKELLKTKAIESLVDLSYNLVVLELTKLKAVKPEAELSNTKQTIAWKAAFDYSANTFTSDKELRLLDFENLGEFQSHFQKVRGEKGVSMAGAISGNEVNADEQAIRVRIREKLTTLFPKMTFDAWTKQAEDTVTRNINREIATMYKKREQGVSQVETMNAITQGAGVGDGSTIEQLINTRLKKHMKHFESQLRAKYLADPKNQGSNAANNGRNSSKNNGGSSSKSSKQKQTKQKTPKQQLPKTNQQQQQRKNQQKSRKRKQGEDQGDAASGARKRRRRSQQKK
jgi:hypothetical protein